MSSLFGNTANAGSSLFANKTSATPTGGSLFGGAPLGGGGGTPITTPTL